jgi:hypothetical protein
MRLQSEPDRAGWGLIPVHVTLEGQKLVVEVSRASAERDHEYLRQAIRLAHGDLTTDAHVHEIVLTDLVHCLVRGPAASERAAERIGYLLWLALDEGSWAEATEISLAIGRPREGGADLEIALSVS